MAQEKRTALDKLRKLRPFTADLDRQFFVSPVDEDTRYSFRSYYRIRASWDQWAQSLGGKLELLRSMPSGDYLLQVDATVHKWLQVHYFPEISFLHWGSWQPRPSAHDPVPSAVLEGVDLGLTHREVVREIKRNADILGLPAAQLQEATLTFSRFYHRTDNGHEPTANGRLIGPLEIISAILHREGLFIGALPVYARRYARREGSDPAGLRESTTRGPDDGTDRGAKRTPAMRTAAESEVMMTEEREQFSTVPPSSVRQRTSDNEPRVSEARATDSSRKDWLRGLSLPRLK